MSALLVFGAPTQTDKGDSKRDQLRVAEDAEAVIEAIEAGSGGFVRLEPDGDKGSLIWVNKEHIRLVRQVVPGRARPATR
jgi:hypothetical protein